MQEPLPDGIVYTETVVHTAPERYASEAPYQIGIVEIPGHGRVTARINGPAAFRGDARIGDRVLFSGWRDGVPHFITAENRTPQPT
jgi:uncharacterized OB-fold protein